MSAKPCTPGQLHLCGLDCPAAQPRTAPEKVAIAVARLADVRKEDLGEWASDLVRMVGLPATLKLIERWGGARLFIPRPEGLRPDHPLAAAIGFRLAQRLAAEVAGAAIRIPTVRRVIYPAMRRGIAQCRGVYPAGPVARAYGVSEHYVYEIWGEAPGS